MPPTEPAQVGAKFHVQHDFQMDLIAAEPLTTDPVAISYDENGLAWVVEMSDYPYTDKKTDVAFQERTTDLPLGKVRILEDTDGDGVFDRSDIFATELSWPTGIALFDGGAFVAATPDIWYLKDTDGDRRADLRQKVFSGFRKFNVQAVMNNLIWGLDHKIYGAGSSNGGRIHNVAKPQLQPTVLSRNDYQFDPRTLEFTAISGGARFGNTFDDWGNRFLCNIRNPAQHVVLPSHYLARNRYLVVPSAVHDVAASGDTLPVYRTSPPEPWRAVRARRWAAERDKSYPASETAAEGFFTSSSGVTVYRGAAYPQEFRNNLFVGEVAGNLIHRQILEPNGVTFAARRADPNAEMVTSDDNWFRAVNFVNAPDGTLHVLDMYRETIEHPWSIPDDIKAHVDLESGRDRGRIYRLSPPRFTIPPRPQLGRATLHELVQTLANPNSWWRETAHRLIYERQDPSAVEPLRSLLHDSQSPLARLHAFWSLAGLNALRDEDRLRAMNDVEPGMREHGVRLAERRLNESRPLLERTVALADDPQIRVRFQVAFSLGEATDPLAVQALVKMARRDGPDPWMRIALLSSLAENADQVLRQILRDEAAAQDPNLLPFARQLAVMVGARNRGDDVAAIWTLFTELPANDASRIAQVNALLGLGDGLRRAKKSVRDVVASGGSEAVNLMHSLVADAARIANDRKKPVLGRLNAIELIGFGSYAAAQTPLAALLDPREPREIQLAAAKSLASFPDVEVPATLLHNWNGYAPALRAEILDLLLATPARIPAVLDAVEAGIVAPSQISSLRRSQLLTHPDERVKNRATQLLGMETVSPRSEVIAKYQPALGLASDRERGRIVFERECIGCHRLGQRGHDIGPNLSTVRHRTPQEILTHILDPNREVGPNFVQYIVTTDDGRSFAGVITEETATSISLKRAENVTDHILRDNIESMVNTGKSLMPEGLEKNIPIEAMADLLRYVLAK